MSDEYDIYDDSNVRWIQCTVCLNTTPDSATCSDEAFFEFMESREFCTKCADVDCGTDLIKKKIGKVVSSGY